MSRPPSSLQGFISFRMYKQFRWCLQLTSWSWDRAEGFEAAPQSKRHAWEQPVLSKGSGAEVWPWVWVKRGQRAVVEIWDDAKKKKLSLFAHLITIYGWGEPAFSGMLEPSS